MWHARRSAAVHSRHFAVSGLRGRELPGHLAHERRTDRLLHTAGEQPQPDPAGVHPGQLSHPGRQCGRSAASRSSQFSMCCKTSGEVEARLAELTRTRDQLVILAARAAAQDPADCQGYCSIIGD